MIWIEIEGIEPETLDRMGALGMISVFDVEEVGEGVLMDELGMTEQLALEIVERCAARAHEISEQQEKDKKLAEAAAAEEFLSAAVAVYVTALKAAKSVRPLCHWGYWGANGLCDWRRRCTNQTATSGDPLCGFENPASQEAIWNFTQQQLPIVEASDALFPELYLESPLRDSGYSLATIGYRRGEMRSIVRQAVAAGDVFGGRPVLPFIRTFCYMGTLACYDRSRNSSKELSRWGVEAGLTVPYEVGGAGVVIYQEQEAVKDPAELAAQLANVTGNQLQLVVTVATQ